MIKSVLLVIALLVCCIVAENCPPCEREKCPTPSLCVAGVVKDKCSCCDVCGLREGESCDNPGMNLVCGRNMTCTDVGGLSKCLCNYQVEVCGSDGTTYHSPCHILEIVRSEGRSDLAIVNKGPCKKAPSLISGPSHAKNRTGSYVALSCEAEGHPIPTVEWFFTRVTGEVKFLPGDNSDISVNMIGGPEKHQVTGWIQIKELKKDYEGDYTCLAHNEEGRVTSQARVLVRD